jgi:CheY-like chemotaxis protein
MSVSILVVDDESDVAELFRQHFRREARQGTYVCISPLLVRKHSTSLPRASSRG